MNNRFINAKQFISEVRKAVYLFKNLWRENTTALLHAPRQVDKTAVALDIAAGIADSGREVLYVNTERHAEEHTELISRSSERLFIFTPQYESSEDKTDYADLVISGIEEAVSTTGIRTFVIDSVTRIAALSFGRNASPSYVMKRLVALQVRCRLSLLVIAHDTTRSTDRSLLNLADSEIPFENDRTNEELHTNTETSQNVGMHHGASANSQHVASVCDKQTQPDATETSFKHSDAPRCIPTTVAAPKIKQYPHTVKLSRRDRRILRRQKQRLFSKVANQRN